VTNWVIVKKRPKNFTCLLGKSIIGRLTQHWVGRVKLHPRERRIERENTNNGGLLNHKADQGRKVKGKKGWSTTNARPLGEAQGGREGPINP